MAQSAHTIATCILALIQLIWAQQQCYFGPGAENRGPTELVPCMNTGQSACCLLGDICLSGNTCWNYRTGNLYQYGCTDILYEDDSCPYKCGFNTTLSPWTALEYCVDDRNVNNTWTCHAPESCGCEWISSTDMLLLQPRQCKDMGLDARVALYAPSTLAPYLSLPTSIGGSTGYISTTIINGTKSWISTVIPGYTPSPITQLTSYGPQPTQAVLIYSDRKPSASTNEAARPITTEVTPSAGSTSEVSETSSNTTSPTTSDSGLSTGAKAGIGVGVGGGVLIAGLLITTILLCRKRRSKTKSTQQNQYPYPISTPLPASPYFSQAEKNSWKSATYSAPSSPPMMSPHFDPTFPGHCPQVDPSLYSEQRSQRPPSISSPTELAADRPVHELHSEQLTMNGRAEKASDD